MAQKAATGSGGGGSVVVEDIGPSRKKLTITIPATAVSEQLEASLATIAQEAALPGFRPGRAPRRLIERRFGSVLKSEAKNQLVSAAYSKALEEHKLSVLGEPEGNEALEKLEAESGKPMTFSVEVEVAPEFELPSLEGVEVIKPLIEPTEANVDEQIERMRINEGALEPHEKARPGDYCIGKGTMREKDGATLLEIPGAVIQVPAKEKEGKGAILGVMVDDFAKQVGTPSVGDTILVKTIGPTGHENEAIRGKPVEIEFKVEQVQRIIPADTEGLLSRFGIETEKELRETVLLRLNQRVLVEQQMALHQQVARRLIESVEFDLPEKLTARQAERNVQRRRVDLLYRGLNEHQIDEQMAELRSASNETARRELKLFFVLAKVASHLGIQVAEQEVMGRIAQIAAERGVRPEQLRRELMENNQVPFIVQQIREHKALDALVAKAKVSEMPFDEFSRKMQEGAGEPRGKAAARGKAKGAHEDDAGEKIKKTPAKKSKQT